MQIQPVISRLSVKLDDSEKNELLKRATGLNKAFAERSLIMLVEGLIEDALKAGVDNEAIRTDC